MHPLLRVGGIKMVIKYIEDLFFQCVIKIPIYTRHILMFPWLVQWRNTENYDILTSICLLISCWVTSYVVISFCSITLLSSAAINLSSAFFTLSVSVCNCSCQLQNYIIIHVYFFCFNKGHARLFLIIKDTVCKGHSYDQSYSFQTGMATQCLFQK